MPRSDRTYLLINSPSAAIRGELFARNLLFAVAVVVSTGGTGNALAQVQGHLRPNRITIAYGTPQEPESRAIYDALRQRRVLQAFRAYLAPLRLPHVLRLRTKNCDGEVNAWYDEEERQITVCYEYLADALHHAPAQTTAGGVSPEDAVLGPGVYVFLHEIAHAVFHLLNVPVFGREEDAADQLAVYLMLHLEGEMPRRTVAAVVRMYHREAQPNRPDRDDLADVHGLSEQRVYNILCLAYGADPVRYADVLTRDYLPADRAAGCDGEYRQVDHAVRRLIKPYLDRSLMKQSRPRRQLGVLQRIHGSAGVSTPP